MLRAGKAKAEVWPKVSPNVTSVSANGPAAKSPGSDESDNEDRVPVPTYQDSFGNAIQQALDNYKGMIFDVLPNTHSFSKLLMSILL